MVKLMEWNIGIAAFAFGFRKVVNPIRFKKTMILRSDGLYQNINTHMDFSGTVKTLTSSNNTEYSEYIC